MSAGQSDPRQLLAAAVAHHRSGRLAEAEAGYRRLLAMIPDQVDALHLLGVLATQSGRHEAAVEMIGRAIERSRHRPVAEFHSNIGLAFRALGRTDAAIDHFRQAVHLKPDYPEALNNLGGALRDAGQFEEAERCCRRLVALRPGQASAHYALGAVLQAQGRLTEAAESYESALSLQPSYAEALNNLGVVRKEQGQYEAAETLLRRALAARATIGALYNLGGVLKELGRLEEARDAYDRVIAAQPDHAGARFNRGTVRLLLGDGAGGWPDYEWRWRLPSYPTRSLPAPAWDGGDPSGRTILLHAEQGLGDTIQFIRYAPLLRAAGARIVVECQPGLRPVLAGVAGVDQIASRGEPLPAFDYHAALPSLPHLMARHVAGIPAELPYLAADPDLVDARRAQLAAAGRPTVGLVWRGNPNNSDDHKRSVGAQRLAALCRRDDIDWVGLQVDAAPEEIAAFAGVASFRDMGPALTSWAETAAVLAALDMVITVDTAVAHLAGAMGLPAWVLLARVPHWCWRAEGERSPWYPSLTLIRQPRPGDWDSVIAAAAAALESRLPPPAK